MPRDYRIGADCWLCVPLVCPLKFGPSFLLGVRSADLYIAGTTAQSRRGEGMGVKLQGLPAIQATKMVVSQDCSNGVTLEQVGGGGVLAGPRPTVACEP